MRTILAKSQKLVVEAVLFSLVSNYSAMVSILTFYSKKNYNYKMHGRNFLKGQTCKQQHLFEHFAREVRGSFLEDVIVTFMDKTRPKIWADENIIGSMHLRQWHLWVWKMKITRLFLQFIRTLYYMGSLELYTIYVEMVLNTLPY